MKYVTDIHWLEETDSTQNVIQRAVPAYDNLSVVAAKYQSAGRGQRGNTWLAARGLNLTFSILMKFGVGGMPALKASDQFRITETLTLGICDYLESKGIRCSIKWPNDIYVRKRKLCGMLIENVLDGEYVARSVAGIGLNVNQTGFPPQLVNPVSMTGITGGKYDLEEELRLLCDCITGASRFPLTGPNVSEEYIAKLYQLNEFHEYSDCLSGSTFEGKIVGVSGSGMLQMETRKGKLKEFAFKEISYLI